MSKIVTLDAGHGGADYGAVGFGVSEKSVVLELVRLTKDYLLRNYEGLIVHLTRSDDTFLTLSERRELTNKLGSDVFVSFHLNAFSREGAKGFEGFTTPGRTSADSLAEIILSKYEKRFPDRKQRYDMRDGDKDKEAKFSVLWAKCPCFLMEFGFITNNEENAWLQKMSVKQAQAKVIGDGIAEFLGLKKKTSGTSGTSGTVSPNPSDELESKIDGLETLIGKAKVQVSELRKAVGKLNA